MIALLLFNETARMSRPFHCDDVLKLSVCRWLVDDPSPADRLNLGEATLAAVMLDAVFAAANADDRPNGEHERSACVGDVIILGGEAYTIGQSGFERIALSIERGSPETNDERDHRETLPGQDAYEDISYKFDD